MEVAHGPDDHGEASPSGTSANTHFFRPNDGIYVSEGAETRTICVSPHLPPAMARSDWQVEQFELHKELYRGKTSLLYMATDRQSGTQVALKLYRKRKLSILNRYQVEREVRLHINLRHENIIHLYAAFEDEKHVYMVQEFAVCGDLFEDLKKGGGQLKEKYAVRDVIVPFLSALAYLHSQGIIHRDIKPENILLGANKTVKVADFGLSINIHHERPVTRAGTLDYMAPEVLVCPDKRRPEENKDKVLLGYTAQVDSWAVGILAYELLVGYPPFEQESRAATYEHIMYKEPKYPAWMTEDAKKFIGVALCKNASQRPTVFDLMQQAWVLPYMTRMTSAGGVVASTPGPSRLRNSVSMMHEDGRDATSSGAATTRPMPPMTVASATGMVPAPPPVPANSAASSGLGPSSNAVHSSASTRLLSQQPVMPAASSMSASGSTSSSVPRAMGQGGAATLNSSASLKSPAPPGANDPITGASGDSCRLHDSISDPTARMYDMNPGAGLGAGTSPQGPHHAQPHHPAPPHHLPHPMPHPSAPSLHGRSGSRSGGGAEGGLGGNGGASLSGVPVGGLDRTGSASLSGMVPPLARVPSMLQSATSGSLTSRMTGRPTPPPLNLEPADASSDHSGITSGGESMPMSPSASSARARGGGGSAGPTPTAHGAATPPLLRHRMGSFATVSGAMGGSAGGGMAPAPPGSAGADRGGRLPAPPASPKPGAADLGLGYHRPASGVLSDDSFLPPARSPSMSLQAQHLSPLQAALMGPRPSSRLNSPSHSRRNSFSQAGGAPGGGGAPGSGERSVPGGQGHGGLGSMPLPQLGADYSDMYTDESLGGGSRVSSSHKYGDAGRGLERSVGGAASGGKVMSMGKLYPGSGADSPMDVPSSSNASFTARPGGSGAVASPMARSAAAMSRVRMMTPEDLRPLMRESSITSTPKSSSGMSGLRDELSQQSMTVYHRPGKVPGVGRAALAARDAEEAPINAAALAASALGKTKSLVNRNLNGALGDEGAVHQLARMGSDVALARTAAGAAAAADRGGPSVGSQRSFTGANSAFARKLANGAIATKVTEYVKGRLPHDEEMED
ncbi:hypothetical protein HYH03_011173 [Edaphochlamys debaryana]|uniref:Protein kinase domain-containing protein n=1 Tax=Edaphochlamys debaryana TaxID=47281 RepID=A0A835XXT3_9CHLO|nr:hypothetical protein HYH03_011173 [Edaphochlamys debaryana]|eukprot:KAG2490371.1 hypothetical protein HYH03_011173 [Edaphochlamys debaryana]